MGSTEILVMLKKEKQEIILKRRDLETAWLRVAVRYRFLGVYMVSLYQQFIAAHIEFPFPFAVYRQTGAISTIMRINTETCGTRRNGWRFLYTAHL